MHKNKSFFNKIIEFFKAIPLQTKSYIFLADKGCAHDSPIKEKNVFFLSSSLYPPLPFWATYKNLTPDSLLILQRFEKSIY